MKNFFFFSILILFLLGSCGNSKSNDNLSSAEPSSKDDNSPSVKSEANEGCIMSYIGKYDELLTESDIKKHFKGDLSQAEKEYTISSSEKNRKRDVYTFSWPSDRTRTMTVGNSKMELPVFNQIGLQWVGDDLYTIANKSTPVEQFKAFYRNASQEEIDAAMKIAETKIKEKEGLTKEQAGNAVDMAKGMSAETKFESVEGLGDAAAWVIKENKLVVLVGKITFQVIAEVSADGASNLELAKTLASEVLAKCK